MRVSFPKNTKARCYISSKPHDSSQGAWRAYLKSPSHSILQNTLFIDFTEIEVWRSLTQRSKNVKLYTKAVPAQVWPRAVQSCSLQTWGSAPEAQRLTAAIPNFPKTYDYLWNHYCLWLSSPLGPNIENPPKRIPTEVTNSGKISFCKIRITTALASWFFPLRPTWITQLIKQSH